MTANKMLTRNTDRQRQVMQMRYQYRWRLNQIAGALGVSEAAVHYLLRRAHVRAGLPPRPRIGIRPRKPKLLSAVALVSANDR